MIDPTNTDRAARAQSIIRQYMESQPDAYCESELETAALDLIADILHTVHTNNGDATWVHRVAYEHFLDEGVSVEAFAQKVKDNA